MLAPSNIFSVLISEHTLLPPVRKPSHFTVGQLPLLLPPPLLCQIRTPCQGLCTLRALQNSIEGSCQVCPLSHSAQTPPATPLTAPGYSPSSTPLLSSAVQACFSSLVCAHPAVFLRHGNAVLLRIRHLGCLQLFTSTHHQAVVFGENGRFFLFFSFLFFFYKSAFGSATSV